MKKVLIAIDSFKGSMSSLEAGYAAKEGIRQAEKTMRKPEDQPLEITVKPVADGGEGTMAALIAGLGGEVIQTEVTGPLGKKVNAKYGIVQEEKLAVLEMAEAAGITLVDKEELNPAKATTYGVGEMILDAVKRGCRQFIVGIGGSATTDGGVGMLQALGFEFLDQNGTEIQPGIQDLDKIAEIRKEKVPEELNACHFKVACDVKNPLLGPNGAVYVYGSQKGVQEREKADFDSKMEHYAVRTAEFAGFDARMSEGAGAAGGLGFAFLSYLDAELQSGITIVLDTLNFKEAMAGADLVLTGEGRLDKQTAMGKVPVGIAKLAKQQGCKVLAFAGGVTKEAVLCNQEGIDAFFPIVRGACSLDEAMKKENAERNMRDSVEQVFRLLFLCEKDPPRSVRFSCY